MTMFQRVKSKESGDHFDIPESRFDPAIYEKVDSGKYGGTSKRARRVQYNVKGKAPAKPATDKAPGKPSGENKKKTEKED